jgi:hypothetical protein
MVNPFSGVMESVLVRLGLAIRRSDPDPRYSTAALLRELRPGTRGLRALIAVGGAPRAGWLDAALPPDCTRRQVPALLSVPEAAEVRSPDPYGLELTLQDAHGLAALPCPRPPALAAIHGSFSEINAEPERWFGTLVALTGFGLDAVRILGGTREGIWQPLLPHGGVLVLMFQSALGRRSANLQRVAPP